MPEISKLLIANRGEIACRVIRTARAMGLGTVAVYSEADRNAPHTALADEAILIGPPAIGESYLNAEALITACRATGADALHPGYGFLSENAGFARACAAAGIVFIGPPAGAIELMGSKRAAKAAMLAAGVPCIPGYQGAEQSDAKLHAEALKIGFPLMIKASWGGGGRGMRLVRTKTDFAASLQTARSEALSAFGSDEVILERALIAPRHIEIQIFADAHGAIVHLAERDCSIQRRHQKVVEEAPSPFVTPDLRAAMGKAAVAAARACDYQGAGTVEFLVDKTGAFYFLEMNTRLQVEHPVTEAITGLDLVEWQLQTAMGAPLPCTQDEITLDGWAMEVRLYAEDPQNGFLPQTGRILDWDPATGPGLRIDDGIGTGQKIDAHYDPMLAKIIAHGPTRDVARRRLARAVERTVLLGLATNKGFLADILRDPGFAAGDATTAFLEDWSAGPAGGTKTPDLATLTLAALLFMAEAAPAGALFGWQNTAPDPWPFTLDIAGQRHRLCLWMDRRGDHLTCRAESGEQTVDLSEITITPRTIRWTKEGLRHSTRFGLRKGVLFLDAPEGGSGITNLTHSPPEAGGAANSGQVIAPMDGRIVSVAVAIGDRVTSGQTLAVLEAMKMEHPLVAGTDGVITELSVRTGSQIRIRQVVAEID